jgi:hypothetical protein
MKKALWIFLIIAIICGVLVAIAFTADCGNILSRLNLVCVPGFVIMAFFMNLLKLFGG